MATILVVEDERLVARDLQQSLTALGYAVPATAASCDEALRLAGERPFDLVLMDIRIQGEPDGIATAQLLRDRFDVPIVYLTAYGDEETLARAKATEPVGYLLKPVTEIDLRTTVEVALHRRESERRLRARDRWFATLARSIGDGLISTDPQGHITFMNPAAEALTGWPAREALGRGVGDVLRLRDEQSKAPLADPTGRAMREGRIVRLAAAALLPVNGEERVVADSAAPILGERGEIEGAVIGFHDVTEERRLQRQLERASRLESLGTLAARVAHEINNPLAYILANVEIALEDLGEPGRALPAAAADDLRAALAEARSGVEQVRRIVADLGVFSRPDAGAPAAVGLRAVLDWSVGVTAAAASGRARVVKRYGDVPDVVGDETRLRQVFTNLLTNAAYSIPEGRPEANAITITAGVAEAGAVAVEIRDTGSGMTDEVKARIFDPYFTTKPIGHGTGLGLAVCHSIVTALGGRIEVDSEVGRGSAFRVRLPAAPAAVASGSSPPVAAARSAPRMRILVVDDDAILREALRRGLERHHEVATATTSTQALELIHGGARFDVILCDVMMPILSGQELHAALLAFAPDQAQRIVFMTGGAFTEEAQEFLLTLAHPPLEKPFVWDELELRLEAVLEHAGPAPAAAP